MKNLYIIFLMILASVFAACDEDEELPEFLDGTEFGVLLRVENISTDTIFIDAINTTNLSFDITYDDAERPVSSIVVEKTFIAADGTASDKVEQTTVSSSPSSASLSVADLVSGISGLSVDDVAAGDSFSINFITNYADGLVVDNYGTGVNPNFSIVFAE